MGTDRKNKQKIDRKFFAAKFQVITKGCWRIDLILYNYSRGENKCRCQCQWRCGEIKEAERSTLTTSHKNGLLHALSEFMWIKKQILNDMSFALSSGFIAGTHAARKSWFSVNKNTENGFVTYMRGAIADSGKRTVGLNCHARMTLFPLQQNCRWFREKSAAFLRF